MKKSVMLKPFLLATILLVGQTVNLNAQTAAGGTFSTSPWYFFLSKLGNCTDFLLAKGDLSPNNVKLFNEVARSLGIADREIKAKNSGFLMRFFSGYNNALAVQLFNRTYFNDSELNKMSEEEKRFVMGHELTHHAKNHAWKKMGVVWMLSVASAVCKKLVEPDSISIKKDSILRRYFLNGWDVSGMATISFWGLLQGQYCQAQEREADQGAVLDAGAHPVDGKKIFTSFIFSRHQ